MTLLPYHHDGQQGKRSSGSATVVLAGRYNGSGSVIWCNEIVGLQTRLLWHSAKCGVIIITRFGIGGFWREDGLLFYFCMSWWGCRSKHPITVNSCPRIPEMEIRYLQAGKFRNKGGLYTAIWLHLIALTTTYGAGDTQLKERCLFRSCSVEVLKVKMWLQRMTMPSRCSLQLKDIANGYKRDYRRWLMNRHIWLDWDIIRICTITMARNSLDSIHCWIQNGFVDYISSHLSESLTIRILHRQIIRWKNPLTRALESGRMHRGIDFIFYKERILKQESDYLWPEIYRT